MRTFKVKIALPTVLAAVISAVVLVAPALLLQAQRTASQTTGGSPQTPSVFTPAHRTALSAVRDFFNRQAQPVQPIAFTHKVHLANAMQCTNCHTGVDTGSDATIPGVKFCMMCHQAIAADRPEIKKLAGYYQRGEDIPWQRVYAYSAEVHVKFNHAPHIRAGVDCATCHGDMTQQTVAVRKVNLTMGFCVNCHRQKKVSVDCTRCHL